MKSLYCLSTPTFTVSLDFELMWGIFDNRNIEDYGPNVRGVHQVIPRMLAIFEEFEIHATWATVGFLFYNDLKELRDDIPEVIPAYLKSEFSSYLHLESIKPTDFKDYYSGVDLISQIRKTSNQEVATHTFSHYYCLEGGQELNSFRVDLKKAMSKAELFNVPIKSIVFPRNQYNEEYLKICDDAGIRSFRGNESNFIQFPRPHQKQNLFLRVIRFMDSYVDLTANTVTKNLDIIGNGLVNVPASFFFRPYSTRSKFLERLKIRRIKSAMLKSAKAGGLFHLWWHPHNFGINQEDNLAQLTELLIYYKFLQNKYGMRSLNMMEIAHEATQR